MPHRTSITARPISCVSTRVDENGNQEAERFLFYCPFVIVPYLPLQWPHSLLPRVLAPSKIFAKFKLRRKRRRLLFIDICLE